MNRMYKIPRIELHCCPSNEFFLEHQVQFMLAFIVGGSFPIANYVFRDKGKRCNKIMVFLDSLLMDAKFKGLTVAEKMTESITHEIFHAHVKQEFSRNFIGEEVFAKKFANIKPSPPPFKPEDKQKCKQCRKETLWEYCPVCSIEELI